MIHGLGSNPLIWARLSNAVWGAADLLARFQIWQVVYQTDVPLLAARLHVHDYLEDAWHMLDPGGDAPARSGAVLVGHSLGGELPVCCVSKAAMRYGTQLFWSRPSRSMQATKIGIWSSGPSASIRIPASLAPYFLPRRIEAVPALPRCWVASLVLS